MSLLTAACTVAAVFGPAFRCCVAGIAVRGEGFDVSVLNVTAVTPHAHHGDRRGGAQGWGVAFMIYLLRAANTGSVPSAPSRPHVQHQQLLRERGWQT